MKKSLFSSRAYFIAIALSAFAGLGCGPYAHAADQSIDSSSVTSGQPSAPAQKAKRKVNKEKSRDQADLYLPDSASSIKEQDMPDYIEPVNRAIFGFNQFADRNVLRPVAIAYRDNVPEQGREMVGNFLQNIASPITFANSIVQGDFEHSFVTFWRFFVNTTIGVGGLFDPAEDMGLPYRKEDFGQTLGTYGVGPGTYIVLPIIGPSSLRDTGGMVADYFFDPVTYIPTAFGSDYDYAPYIVDTARVIQGRTDALNVTDTVNSVSLDPYAFYRSGYAQRRAQMVHSSGGVGPEAKNAGNDTGPEPMWKRRW